MLRRHAASSLADPQPPSRGSWWDTLSRLKDWYGQHGRLPRSKAGAASPLLAGERPLGLWCVKQRHDGRAGRLAPDQAAGLQGIPGWEFDLRAAAWRRQVQAVAEFAGQHGRLPREKGSEAQPLLEGEQALGWWCDRQRMRRRGHGLGLTAAEKAQLEALPHWGWEPWEEGSGRQLQEVAAFVEQHGRLPRQKGGKERPLVEGERPLAKWCKTQRQRRRGHGKGAKLTPEEAEKLAALPGWQWGDPRDEAWQKQCRAVAAFVEQHGRLPREKGSKAQPLLERERSLGQWCWRQRQRRWGHESWADLTQEQVAELDAIPGWTWGTSRAT